MLFRRSSFLKVGNRHSPADYFSILGVSRKAGREEIKRAYKQQVKKWHPDKKPPGSREQVRQRFQRIVEAYETLRDDGRKLKYLEKLKLSEIPLCSIPGCGNRSDGKCSWCGAPACALHLQYKPEYDKGSNRKRYICNNCLPTCDYCGTILTGNIPQELKPVEEKLKKFKPMGRFCADCLREATVFSCSGCGKGHLGLDELKRCQLCGRDFCSNCMSQESDTQGEVCFVCSRLAMLENRKSNFTEGYLLDKILGFLTVGLIGIGLIGTIWVDLNIRVGVFGFFICLCLFAGPLFLVWQILAGLCILFHELFYPLLKALNLSYCDFIKSRILKKGYPKPFRPV